MNTLRARFVRVLGAVALAAALFGPRLAAVTRSAPAPLPATFGHPTTVSVSQYGFEPDLRFDSHGAPFTTVPGTSSAGTSYMWHSSDGGLSFHLVPASTPYAAKLPTCPGGGDTEIAFDGHNRLYFNDLQNLTNFSTSRSDDEGTSFSASCAAVPGTGVDRQWYAIDGDPLTTGHVYLTFDRVAQDTPSPACTPGTNELVITESPPPGVPGSSAVSGLQFGPLNNITPSCNEGIMGPDVVTPIANSDGTHDVFVVHDNNALDSIYVARCAPVAVTVDPSGLQCTNLPIYTPPTPYGDFVGQNFPAMDIDRAGNIYVVWSMASSSQSNGSPSSGLDTLTGPSRLYLSVSHDMGQTWTAPVDITAADPTLDGGTNVLPWVAAGDDGRIDVVWYGTSTATDGNTPPTYGADFINGDWNVYMAQSLNADCRVTSAKCQAPTFTISQVSEHLVHRGSIQTLNCPTTTAETTSCNRALGDFLNVRPGPHGEAAITYVDTTNVNGEVVGQNMFVRQIGGDSLYAADDPVTGPTPLMQAVDDPAGSASNDDASFDAAGTQTSQAGTNLDILSSYVTHADNSHLRIVMKVANLQSLAPPSSLPATAGTVIDWITQWHYIDSSGNGGQNYFAYMESNNGAAPTFYDGTACFESPSDIVYPGANQISGSIDQKSGTITIDVPLADIGSPSPGSTLYDVTASTLTLAQPATTGANSTCLSGQLFNVIDSSQPYTAVVPGPTDSQAEDVPLKTGWNLISLPRTGINVNTASALVNTLNTARYPVATVRAVATFVNGTYQLFVPGYTPDLNLSPTQGIFVLSSAVAHWIVYGSSYPSGQTVQLQPGWNAVAAPYPEPGLRTDQIAAQIGAGVQEIATYDPTTGYSIWTPGGSTPAFTVPSTSGMYILMSQSATWQPTPPAS